MAQRPPTPPQGPQLPIELPDDVAQGQYSNLMFMTHSPSEFVLDFARLLPGARKGIVYSRIIMTPQHAKALHELLERNLESFEERHGTIKLPGKTSNDPRIGFTPTASPSAEPNAARE
jgi:hypothetical protein